MNQKSLLNRLNDRSRRSRPNTNIVTVLIIVVILFIDVLYLRHHRYVAAGSREVLRTYTHSELSGYNGRDEQLPVLLAMDGLVYDISGGRDRYYGPGKPYHALAGSDASALLHIAGGDIVRKKYKVVGRLVP